MVRVRIIQLLEIWHAREDLGDEFGCFFVIHQLSGLSMQHDWFCVESPLLYTSILYFLAQTLMNPILARCIYTAQLARFDLLRRYPSFFRGERFSLSLAGHPISSSRILNQGPHKRRRDAEIAE